MTYKTYTIPTNMIGINEKEVSEAIGFITERLKNETLDIIGGYNGHETTIYVVGGGLSNDSGMVLHMAEAYEVLKAFRAAGYHTWVQWTANDHYMRGIVVSCVERNLSPRYFEKY